MNPHPRDPTESCLLCPEQVTPHPHQCGHPTCPSSPRASLPDPVTSAALHSAGSALGQRPPALNGDPPRKHRTRPWDQRCFPPPRDGADPRLGPRSLQGRLVCHSRAPDRPRDGRALAVPSPSLPVLAPSRPRIPGPKTPGQTWCLWSGRAGPTLPPASTSWCSWLRCQGQDSALVPAAAQTPRPRLPAAPPLLAPGRLPTPRSGSKSGCPQGQGGVLSAVTPGKEEPGGWAGASWVTRPGTGATPSSPRGRRGSGTSGVPAG